MSRQPSTETLLAREKALSRKLAIQLQDARADRDAYRSRATQAEQQVAEWKQRFDKLLERSPVTQSGEQK